MGYGEGRASLRRSGAYGQTRRRDNDELRRMVETGRSRRTPKSLLKLVIHTNGIKASEAAEIIGVRKRVVEDWARILKGKNLVEIEGPDHPDATIKPTAEALMKLDSYRGGTPVAAQVRRMPHAPSRAAVEVEAAPPQQRKPAADEHPGAGQGEERHIIEGMSAELFAERKHGAELEEKLKAAGEENVGESEGRVRELEERLGRERAERVKLEEVVRRKQEELDSRAKEAGMLSGDEPLDRRIADGERMLSDVGRRITDVKGRLGEGGGDLKVVVDEEEEVSRLLAEEIRMLKRRSSGLGSKGGNAGA